MKNPAVDPISAGFSFPKRFRLLAPSEYKQVFDQPPLRCSHQYFLLLSKPNGLTQARIGLVVPKKAVKLAVERNRIKRILRESFRKQTQILKGLDIIFLAKNGVQGLSNQDLSHQINGQWRQLLKRQNKLANVSNLGKTP